MRQASYNDFVKIFFDCLADDYSERTKMAYYSRYIDSEKTLAKFIMEVELPTSAAEAA